MKIKFEAKVIYVSAFTCYAALLLLNKYGLWLRYRLSRAEQSKKVFSCDGG